MLQPPDEALQPDGLFGISVAVSGDGKFLAVGASGLRVDDLASAGAVFVYQLNEAQQFQFVAKLLPSFSNNIHYEAELVLKIDRAGKCISKEHAPTFISGVSLGLDFTARDIQDECKVNGHPWELAKSFDFSAAAGEFVERGRGVMSEQ